VLLGTVAAPRDTAVPPPPTVLPPMVANLATDLVMELPQLVVVFVVPTMAMLSAPMASAAPFLDTVGLLRTTARIQTTASSVSASAILILFQPVLQLSLLLVPWMGRFPIQMKSMTAPRKASSLSPTTMDHTNTPRSFWMS
jgi:hypothetical protein